MNYLELCCLIKFLRNWCNVIVSINLYKYLDNYVLVNGICYVESFNNIMDIFKING